MDNKNKGQKIQRVILNSYKYLKSIKGEDYTMGNHVPEQMQPYISQNLRNIRKQFDILEKTLSLLPKDSNEYIQTQADREKLAKSLITMRKQIDLYNNNQKTYSESAANINPGTKDMNYYINSAVYGNQWDTLGIDDEGKFHFGLSPSEDIKNIEYHKLDDIPDNNPIITKPFKEMKYILDLANLTKANKDKGKEFDENWVYNNVLNNFTDGGSSVIIGLAHADLAGDGRTKSFAEMYETGLNDPLLYIHPETGEQLPKDTEWMKDSENAEILNVLMSKHITNTMKEIAGVRGILPAGTGYLHEEVTVTGERELNEAYGAGAPIEKEKEEALLPNVSEEENRNPKLVADKGFNQRVNDHIKKSENIQEGIKSMPKKDFNYYLKRMREAIKGTSVVAYLKEMIALRKAAKNPLTPEQLIKKYSK